MWLTPNLDWRHAYDGWGALAKLEYMDGVMKEIAHEVPEVPEPSDDDHHATAHAVAHAASICMRQAAAK